MASPQASGGLDRTAQAVLFLAALLAACLILVPLAILLFSAFRGPADYLPFEDGAGWSLDNILKLASNVALLKRLLPDTLISVGGTVAATSTLAFALAWLIERTDLSGRGIAYVLILFPLLVPTNILAVAWIYLMGPNAGWLNQVLRPLLGLSGPGPIDVFSMG